MSKKTCQISRGLFSIRTCGARAIDRCKKCGKHYCQEHDSIPATPKLCCVCQAKKARRQGQQSGTGQGEVTDRSGRRRFDDGGYGYGYGGVGWSPIWYYGYRDDYYRRNRYRPHSHDDNDAGTFDEHDSAGFADGDDGDVFDS